MEFRTGEKVMHRVHGGGEIVGMRDVELVEGYEHYYEIRFPEKELTINLPIRRAEELGLRPVMGESKLQQVLAVLGGLPDRLAQDYKVRQNRVREMLKEGAPMQLACAVRDLTWRGEDGSLTMGDNKLLTQARTILSAEIALVRAIAVAEAQSLIDQTLQRSMSMAQA